MTHTTKDVVVNGFFWTFGLKILSAVIQIGTIAILSRILIAQHFGTMGILVMIVGFSKIISEFGLGAALIQKSNLISRDYQTVLAISILFALFFSLTFFFLSKQIAIYFNDSTINLPLKVICLIFIIDSIIVVQNAIAQKNLDFKFIAITAFISYFIGTSLITILLAYLDYGIWALVIGYMFQSVSTLTFYLLKYGLHLPYIYKASVKKLFNYGFFFTIGRIANYFANNGDYFIIGKVLGVQSLGYYTRAYQMMSSPANLLGGTIQKIFFPLFAKIQNEKENIIKYYTISNILLSYLSLFVSVIVAFYSSQIVHILLGPGWDSTIFPLRILALSLVFKLGYKSTTPIMNAMGLVKIRSMIEVSYLCFILAGTFLGSFWGINGASIGVLIALVLNFAISNFYCSKHLGLNFNAFITPYVKPLTLGTLLLIALVILSINWTFFILYIILMGVIFLFALKNGLFKNEIYLIRMLKK